MALTRMGSMPILPVYGQYMILQRVVEKALSVIGDRLDELFNASIAHDFFLTSWKRAKLLALKLATVPTTPSDFRPIALLCFLSKVLEKLAYDQIVSFLENGF